jgi:hypothetical protein
VTPSVLILDNLDAALENNVQLTWSLLGSLIQKSQQTLIITSRKGIAATIPASGFLGELRLDRLTANDRAAFIARWETPQSAPSDLERHDKFSDGPPQSIALVDAYHEAGVSPGELADRWCALGPDGFLPPSPVGSLSVSVRGAVDGIWLRRNPAFKTILSLIAVLPFGVTDRILDQLKIPRHGVRDMLSRTMSWMTCEPRRFGGQLYFHYTILRPHARVI